MTESAVRPRERSFGPTVSAGLLGAVLTAVAATRQWAHASADAAGIKVQAAVTGSDTAPLAAALALVALAAWGVVLVVRGRVRRLVAAVGLLACVGVLVAVAEAFDGAREDAVAAAVGKGATADLATASLSGWYYTAGAAALLTLLAFAVAVLRSPRWPAMGSRYDAPAARAEAPATDEDMWRALDEGRDPTS
ncbi:MAG TPA: Trp biosynthesis-associated membrane protein [Nocardioidaceae bacterium]|nr:Trp biosynthesis-associated membrane protein [Nocardioidaceae bacterium]